MLASACQRLQVIADAELTTLEPTRCFFYDQPGRRVFVMASVQEYL